jgi:nitrite reductase/ring-hydroxylating ferredoxin subunit
MNKVFACNTADLQPGDGRRIDVPDHTPVAVFNVDGKFYAADDTCTHGDASLSDGFMEGCIIECPFHAGTFDVCTGKALTHPVTKSLQVYPIQIEDGRVFIVLGDDGSDSKNTGAAD